MKPLEAVLAEAWLLVPLTREDRTMSVSEQQDVITIPANQVRAGDLLDNEGKSGAAWLEVERVDTDQHTATLRTAIGADVRALDAPTRVRRRDLI